MTPAVDNETVRTAVGRQNPRRSIELVPATVAECARQQQLEDAQRAIQDAAAAGMCAGMTADALRDRFRPG